VLAAYGIPASVARAEVVLPCVGALVFVIALPRSITAIGKFSILGVCSVVYVAALLIHQAATRAGSASHIPMASTEHRVSLGRMANACAIIIASFLCQYNVFFVYADVSDPTVRRLRKITRLSALFQTTFYVTIAMCGYASFGESTNDNIYTNFPGSDRWVDTGRALVCASLCVGIPLCTFAARANLVGLLSRLLSEEPTTCAAAVSSSAASVGLAYAASLDDEAAGDGVHVSGFCTHTPLCSRPHSRTHSAASCPTPSSSLAAPLCTGPDPDSTSQDVASVPDDVQSFGAAAWLLHVGSTASILLLTLALAFVMPSISFLLGKLGGICGVTQMYVLPGLALLRNPDLRPPVQCVQILCGFAAATLVGLMAVVL